MEDKKEIPEKDLKRSIEKMINSELNDLTIKQIRERLSTEYNTSMEPYKPQIKYLVNEILKADITKPETPIKRKLSDRQTSASSSTTTTTSTDNKNNKKIKTEKGLILSKELQDLIGLERATSKEIYQLLWEHIKYHNLQKSLNKKEITCDSKLKKKVIKNNTFKPDEVDEDGNPLPNLIKLREDKKTDALKNGKGNELSEKMADFMGCERSFRGLIVKKLWTYIKENNLQNPKNKKQILFDEKLKNLFGVAKVDQFGLANLISKHLY